MGKEEPCRVFGGGRKTEMALVTRVGSSVWSEANRMRIAQKVQLAMLRVSNRLTVVKREGSTKGKDVSKKKGELGVY